MFVIPSWCDRLLKHFEIDGPTGAGISGGRTSGMMHALTLAANPGATEYQGCFANTGRENEVTLRFLYDIDRHSPRPLAWLEFRPPPVWGQAPRFAQTAVVNFETAHRGGRIFEDFLATLAAYRQQEKGEGPVAPHSTMRLCTSYMKLKTIHRWLEEWLDQPYMYRVGLRFDEPDRVDSLLRQSTARCDFECPLYEAGITRAMVNEFWAMQPFDLQLAEPYGNCSLCFLKDEADIATIMLDDEEEAKWWLDLQDRYGDFRRGQTSMRTIFAEAKMRVRVIRPAVRAYQWAQMSDDFTVDEAWLKKAQDDAEVAYQRRLNKWEERRLMGEPLLPKPRPGKALSRSLDEWRRYRWDLLVKQEERLRDEGRKAFSCACESAQLAGAADDDAQVRMW